MTKTASVMHSLMVKKMINGITYIIDMGVNATMHDFTKQQNSAYQTI